MTDVKKSYSSLDPLDIEPPEEPAPVVDGDESETQDVALREELAAAARAERDRLEEEGG